MAGEWAAYGGGNRRALGRLLRVPIVRSGVLDGASRGNARVLASPPVQYYFRKFCAEGWGKGGDAGWAAHRMHCVAPHPVPYTFRGLFILLPPPPHPFAHSMCAPLQAKPTAAVPAGASAVTQGEFKLFQQALKATHSGRWSNRSQVKIPGEANYTDM